MSPVTALEETAFLVTVAWAPGSSAWDQELGAAPVDGASSENVGKKR